MSQIHLPTRWPTAHAEQHALVDTAESFLKLHLTGPTTDGHGGIQLQAEFSEQQHLRAETGFVFHGVAIPQSIKVGFLAPAGHESDYDRQSMIFAEFAYEERTVVHEGLLRDRALLRRGRGIETYIVRNEVIVPDAAHAKQSMFIRRLASRPERRARISPIHAALLIDVLNVYQYE